MAPEPALDPAASPDPWQELLAGFEAVQVRAQRFAEAAGTMTKPEFLLGASELLLEIGDMLAKILSMPEEAIHGG
jgi:hypothetical protein